MSIARFIVDSGAFSLFEKHASHGDYSYFASKEFAAYRTRYIEFLHENPIKHYVNLDVIFNPKLTWQDQLILESEGLQPIPVVHYGTPLRWLRKYIDAGYGYIGIGGPDKGRWSDYPRWADPVFEVIGKARHEVRTHGFKMTSTYFHRYPWYSVDSSTWLQAGSKFGTIWMPPRGCDGWRFDVVGNNVPIGRTKRKEPIDAAQDSDLKDWLATINVPLEGVIKDEQWRRIANAKYFHRLGLNNGKHVYLSSGNCTTPEDTLADANVMLSFYALDGSKNGPMMKRLRRYLSNNQRRPTLFPWTECRDVHGDEFGDLKTRLARVA